MDKITVNAFIHGGTLSDPIELNPYSFTNRASVVSNNYDFVGLKNYVELLTNKYFQQAFLHTVQFTVIYVIGANVLGLTLALMLSRSSKFNNLARTIMFIPFTVALTSGAIMWSYVFTDVYSPLFQKMSPLGLSSQVIPAMAVIAIWRDMGYCMLIPIQCIMLPFYINLFQIEPYKFKFRFCESNPIGFGRVSPD